MIYLIHFKRPFRHAQHYLGSTTLPIGERLVRHYNGDGARLLQVIQKAGIPWTLVRVWNGSRDRERQLKKHSHSRDVCPVCRGKISFQRAENMVITKLQQAGQVIPGTGAFPPMKEYVCDIPPSSRKNSSHYFFRPGCKFSSRNESEPSSTRENSS